ncbi:MAG: hypothetical protein COX82_04850 [Candidatus Magasanikbacteria bacterium CG_4_10_14_0_2_um_filter_41_10]|uniref:Fibronectin type-III domain-containing protein n=1 Tax=Candidatus Magasanikbacteria bacterium CG_4_10_14_0_2_um_filter_41_10 TaxID=1974638 RepID=A0A2M7V1Z6_9BACT|nr:MAG: hypothetical protein COX82_04850 [Candidatus Magasanikbacteria bacterium CG_4_10_14_0_2_um_filter_41_10]
MPVPLEKKLKSHQKHNISEIVVPFSKKWLLRIANNIRQFARNIFPTVKKRKRIFFRFLRVSFVTTLLFAWIFSGWPHIGKFPPKTQNAQAASAITLISGGAISGNRQNGADVTLPFPVGVMEGDVVIVYGGHPWRSGYPDAGVSTSGYTQIALNNTAAPGFGAWYKVMGATPDTSVIGVGTGHGADGTAYAAYILRGVDPSIFDQTTVTAGPITSTNPNPPSIVTQTDGAWVLALAGSRIYDTSPGTISGYSNVNGNSGNDNVDISVHGATLEKTTHGTEDPAAWSTWSSGNWFTITIALKPYSTAPSLSISQPDGVSSTVNIGDSYDITYSLSDNDDVVTAAFYYDTNNSGLDGTAITGACATAAEGNNATCSWNTTGMTAGTYYIYGVSDDGINPTTTAYSSGPITITLATPSITTSTPSGSHISIDWDAVLGASYYSVVISTTTPVTEAIVGTNTTNSSALPISRFYNYSSSEMLYLNSELNGLNGDINSLAFYKSSGLTSVTIDSVDIYLKTTTDTTLPTGTTSLTGYTQVYSGSFPNTSSTVGWMSVNLDTPFTYNSTDNLQILVVKNFQDYAISGYPYYRYTSTGSFVARSHFSDTVAWSSSVNMTQTYSRPNITFSTDGNLSNIFFSATTTASNYDFTGLTTSTLYNFQVAARDGSGNFSASSTAYSTSTIANDSPTLSLSQPDGTADTINIGDSYNITYSLSDDDVVTASFYYDTDASGLDGTAISGACATAVEGTDATCSWDTTGMTAGTYYVYGLSNDGVNATTSAYSSGQITINIPTPSITSSTPDTTNITVNWDTVLGASIYTIAIATSTPVVQTSVGTATTNNNQLPVNRCFDYSASEIIYLQSELGGMTGNVTSLDFYKASGEAGVTISGVTIYMKHTSATTLSTGTTTLTGYTQVYSGSFPNTVANGWVSVDLDTPFVYNGTDNIELFFVKDYEFGYSLCPYYRYTTTGAGVYRATYYGATEVWTDGVTNMSQTMYRPNIRFNTMGASFTDFFFSTTTTNAYYNFTGLTPSTMYYFQMAALDGLGHTSASSSVYSTSTTFATSLTVDIVDGSYASVSSPTMAMNATSFSLSCQTVTSTFGNASEQIYINNNNGANNGWTLTMAAVASSSLWTSAGTPYDFNDSNGSGCTDGADANDAVGGQMSVDPSLATLTVGQCSTGCTTTNVSKGSSASFVEGVTDSITLLTATGASDDVGDWLLKGIGISQTIPAEQTAASDYNINFVLTLTAS